MPRRPPLSPRVLAAVLATAAALGALATTALARPHTSAPKPTVVTGVFGRRYCEILLARRVKGVLSAKVYNTYGLNNCPPAAWRKVDFTAVAKTNHAIVALPNGPRFWLMNSITKNWRGARVIKDLGGIRMIEEASIIIGSQTGPYSVHRVDRSTTFAWKAGQKVYELLAPGGATWVMQSYSRQIDPSLTRAQLARLGSRLHLPTGWRYRVRTLKHPLSVVTVKTAAQVLQDNLDNTYSRI